MAHDFVSHFASIASPARVIVAPEALSRFYVEGLRGGSHAGSAVGASWMTREDRASEIADQIVYLDAVHDTIFALAERTAARLTVLGFSQGTATVCRWLAHSRARADRLICWGGAIPEDIGLRDDSPLRRVELLLVAGSRDEFATAERVAQQEATLDAAGVPFTTTKFVGGHRLDNVTLQRLADREPSGPGAV
jgi:predicted esterase